MAAPVSTSRPSPCRSAFALLPRARGLLGIAAWLAAIAAGATLVAALVAASVTASVGGALHGARLVLETASDGDGAATFAVLGLDPDAIGRLAALDLAREAWQELFSVHVEDESRPPMLGDYGLRGDRLELIPAYGLSPGVRYRAVFRPAALTALVGAWSRASAPLARDFALAHQPTTPSTRITAVYPSTDRLPENLLKLYVHFSATMSQGVAYRHLSLLGPDGLPIELPFVELEEELWDPSGRRLTVLFDPGRIKSGLVPRRETGPALRAGATFTFVVDSAWPDATGATLASGHRKDFEVTAHDDRSPDPDAWALAVPAAFSRDPLVVKLDEPLDNALLQRLVSVIRDGDRLKGEIELDDRERRWLFRPAAPWRPVAHRLQIDPWLEDLAGNRVGAAFEVRRHAGDETPPPELGRDRAFTPTGTPTDHPR